MLVRKECHRGCGGVLTRDRIKESFSSESDQAMGRDAEKNTNLSRSMPHLASQLARPKCHFSLAETIYRINIALVFLAICFAVINTSSFLFSSDIRQSCPFLLLWYISTREFSDALQPVASRTYLFSFVIEIVSKRIEQCIIGKSDDTSYDHAMDS